MKFGEGCDEVYYLGTERDEVAEALCSVRGTNPKPINTRNRPVSELGNHTGIRRYVSLIKKPYYRKIRYF
jgi:hypothetical protein